jgi:hypothetical protein
MVKRKKKSALKKRAKRQRKPAGDALDLSFLPDAKMAIERLESQRGRPLTLTQEIEDQVVRVLRQSGTLEDAAHVVGIAKATLHLWRKLGRTEPNANGGIYRHFLDSVERAITARRFAREAVILKAGLKDWRAEAWALERSEPIRFAPRVRVHVENELTNVIARIENEFADSPEVCDRILAAISGGSGASPAGGEESGEAEGSDDSGGSGETVLSAQPEPEAGGVPPARR